MGFTVFFTVNPKFDLKILPLESWVIFFTVICFSRVAEFVFSLRKIILDDAKIYLESKKSRQAPESEQIVTEANV